MNLSQAESVVRELSNLREAKSVRVVIDGNPSLPRGWMQNTDFLVIPDGIDAEFSISSQLFNTHTDILEVITPRVSTLIVR